MLVCLRDGLYLLRRLTTRCSRPPGRAAFLLNSSLTAAPAAAELGFVRRRDPHLMHTRFLLLAFMFFFASSRALVAASVLPPDITAAFASADRVILYSLDPEPHAGSGFHDFRILRYTVIDVATRQQLAAALQRDVQAGGVGDLCFLPRHGVRLITGRTIYDLVICYQCGHVYIYSSGQPMRSVGIAGSTAYLDGILTPAPNHALQRTEAGGTSPSHP